MMPVPLRAAGSGPSSLAAEIATAEDQKDSKEPGAVDAATFINTRPWTRAPPAQGDNGPEENWADKYFSLHPQGNTAIVLDLIGMLLVALRVGSSAVVGGGS